MHVFTQRHSLEWCSCVSARVCVCSHKCPCLCVFTSISHFHSAGDKSVQLYMNSCCIFSGIRDALYIHETPGSTQIHTNAHTHLLLILIYSSVCSDVIGHVTLEQGTLNPSIRLEQSYRLYFNGVIVRCWINLKCLMYIILNFGFCLHTLVYSNFK